MLKSDQSTPKYFSPPAVLCPNWAGSGYNASRPLKADRLISHRVGQFLMQIGHMPLVQLASLTLSEVPVVDFAFR